MGWIKQKKDEHFCKLPRNATGVHRGDQWQCDTCLSVYEVTSIIPAGRGGYLDEWYDASLLWRKKAAPNDFQEG